MWPYKPVFRFLGWGVSETEAAAEANRQVPLGDVHPVSESVLSPSLSSSHRSSSLFSGRN